MANLSHAFGFASDEFKAKQNRIEDAAQQRYEADHPSGPSWNRMSKWLKDSYREEVQKAPR